MHLMGIENQLKLKNRLFTVLVGFLAIIILMMIFWNDIRSIQVRPKQIDHIEIAWLNDIEAGKLYQEPSGLKQLAFIKATEENVGTKMMWQKPADTALQGYFALKMSFDSKNKKTSSVHFNGVLAENFSVFDGDGNLLYQHPYASQLKYYTNQISEFFVEPKTNELYLVGRYNEGFSRIGLSNRPEVGSSVELIAQSLERYRIRQAVAMFLLLLTGILIAMIHSLNRNNAKATIASLAVFFGLFGIWILFDFPRHSYWILESFAQVPKPLLLLFFVISKNYMTYAFVQMSWHFFEKSVSRRIVEILAKLTFITGTFETILELMRFFTWSPQIGVLRDISFDITNWIIILGSIGLIVLALYEAYQGSRRAVIFSIGLSVCLFTFFISQATPLLISHWGVIAMATAIAVILTMSFNEAQKNSRRYTAELKSKNVEMELLNMELEYAQTELLLRLGSTVDLRSHETSLHVQRVAEYTRLIASKLGLSALETEIIAKASTLHDVGKVGIPDAILHMPGKLTPEQYEAMKKHARMGFEILNGSVVQVLDEAAIIALTHHERYDGKGYPEGLKGEDIPIQGLIVSAADVMDALLSQRVYKKAWTLDEVIDYFKSEAGCHFAPEIASIIIESREELEAIIRSMPYEKEMH